MAGCGRATAPCRSLWPLKAKKSQSSSCTSIFMWGVLCAPSMRTGTSCSWAMRTMSRTGLMVPSTLLTCVRLTMRVRSLKSFSYSSRRSRPSSVMGTMRSLMPCRACRSCHETMLLWCSISEMMTSSPSFIKAWPKHEATRLMLSVVPRVKTISLVERALRKRRTVSRDASCSSVACCERKCTPRCTLALTL